MRSLYVENFKAFRMPISLSCPNQENILVYGENGSGKSSLFDAFRLFYFRDRIFNERIPAYIIEGREEEETAVIESFRFNGVNCTLTLRIDNESYSTYLPSDDEQVFLISYSNLHSVNEADDVINISRLVKESYLKCESNVGDWLDEEAERLIIDGVNKALKDIFYMDDLVLAASHTDDGNCTLELKNRVQAKKEHLSRYFNEASLHLVRFLVLMECILLVKNPNKHILLVMDDCFNSLDASNRTFMMRYLFMETEGMQKVIMTHNLSYYNLMSHILNTEHKKSTWLKYVLNLIDGQFFFTSEKIDGVDDIITKRKEGGYTSPAQLGNAIRQHFEVLTYRLAMLCNIGNMQETKDLLDRMCNPNKFVYLSSKQNFEAKTVFDLVDEIYSNVTCGNYYNLEKRLKEKIEGFRANDVLTPLIPALRELRLLQKVALHQASHGHEGLPPVMSKEFDVSLALLKRIESAISSIKRPDLSTI